MKAVPVQEKPTREQLARISRAYKKNHQNIVREIKTEILEKKLTTAELSVKWGISKQTVLVFTRECGFVSRSKFSLQNEKQVIAAIAKDIKAKKLKPGDPIPREEDFKDVYFCSLKTGRDARRALAEEEVIYFAYKKGWHVNTDTFLIAKGLKILGDK